MTHDIIFTCEENTYIYPYVSRNFSTDNDHQDIPMENISAVTDAKDRLVRSARYQNYEGGRSVNTRKFRNKNRSLYDFGLGSSSSVFS